MDRRMERSKWKARCTTSCGWISGTGEMRELLSDGLPSFCRVDDAGLTDRRESDTGGARLSDGMRIRLEGKEGLFRKLGNGGTSSVDST